MVVTLQINKTTPCEMANSQRGPLMRMHQMGTPCIGLKTGKTRQTPISKSVTQRKKGHISPQANNAFSVKIRVKVRYDHSKVAYIPQLLYGVVYIQNLCP